MDRLAPKVLAYYQSNSNPLKKHEIRQSKKDGIIYCTCAGWIFSKSIPKTCKHLSHFNAINQVPSAARFSKVAHIC